MSLITQLRFQHRPSWLIMNPQTNHDIRLFFITMPNCQYYCVLYVRERIKSTYKSREGEFVTELVPKVLMIQNHASCTDTVYLHWTFIRHANVFYYLQSCVKHSCSYDWLPTEWQELKMKAGFPTYRIMPNWTQLKSNFKPVCLCKCKWCWYPLFTKSKLWILSKECFLLLCFNITAFIFNLVLLMELELWTTHVQCMFTSISCVIINNKACWKGN